LALASAIDLANTYSVVYTAVVSFFDASIPRNSGTYRPTSIVAPEGSLVNPRAPAPTTMCSSTRLTRGPRSSSGMAPASASTPSAWSGDASRVS